jgi:hypothetical protein
VICVWVITHTVTVSVMCNGVSQQAKECDIFFMAKASVEGYDIWTLAVPAVSIGQACSLTMSGGCIEW